MCKDEDEQLMNAFDATCTIVSNVRTREDDKPPSSSEEEDELGPSTIDTAPDPPTPPTALLLSP